MQNGDSIKKEIALGQTYFAAQTRKQELLEEELLTLTEDQKRLKKRYQIREENKNLNKEVYKIGARSEEEFSRFHNEGYKGLYNGETTNDIKKRKGLKESEEILDYMGSAELAANYFRITQAELILENSDVSLSEANEIHNKVGKKVRDAMMDISGIAPEKLPTPEKSIQKLESEELQKIQGGCAFLYN